MAGGAKLYDGVLARDGFACLYCGRSAADGWVLTIDHVTPQAWFQTPGFVAPQSMDHPENLAACCTLCNSRKRDMDLEVYALYLRRRFGQDTRAMVRRVRGQLRKPLP